MLHDVHLVPDANALYRWFVIIVYWFICLCTTIAISLSVISFNYSHNHEFNPSKCKKNILRKIFHFLTVVMFTPIYFIDLNFLKISLSLAFITFVLVEWIRSNETFQIYSINYCRVLLTDYFLEFLHLKNGESIKNFFIIDPILLLFGVSWPIWLCDSNTDIKGLSGIITLGVGDAMASVVGNIFGHLLITPTWMKFIIKNDKTLVGWYANIVSMMLFYYMIIQYDLFIPSWPYWILGLISVITGSIEAMISYHNDNILLPIVTFLSLSIAEILLK